MTGIQVVGAALDCEAYELLVETLHPGVEEQEGACVVLAIWTGGIPADVKAVEPGGELVALIDPEPREVARARALGAIGLLTRADAGGELRETLLAARRRVQHYSAALLDGLTSLPPPAKTPEPGAALWASLAPKRRKILELAAAGDKPSVIGHKLKMPESTVKHNVTTLRQMLGIGRGEDLAAALRARGIGGPPP